MMKIDGRRLTPICLLFVFAAATSMAFYFPAKAALLPVIVGSLGTLLCAIQLVVDWRTDTSVSRSMADTSTGAVDDAEVAANDGTKERLMLAWFASFGIILLCVGFSVGGPLAVFLFLWAGSGESVWLSLVFAMVTALALQLVFVVMLGLSLYGGLLSVW